MKQITFIAALFTIVLFSCGEDNDDNIITQANITFSMNHSFDETSVTAQNFTNLDLTNANGEVLNMERFRYLISRIELVNTSGVAYQLKNYHLTDLSKPETLSFNGDISIPKGLYTLRFVWGFNEIDNQGEYQDLNSVSWNWPDMLGGGYHFLQFDGKYNINTSPSPFNFHNGTAKVSDGVFEQNFINIDLNTTPININGDSTLSLNFNIAELFKNPNQWDLNVLDTPLMPNYNAQIMMRENIASGTFGVTQ